MLNRKEEILIAKNLEVCEVSYYDEDNGVEIPKIRTYAIVYKEGNDYYNYFNNDEVLPMIKRVVGKETDTSGIYGTALVPVTLLSGSSNCFIKSGGTFEDIFGRDFITDIELKNYVLRDSRYFKDRKNIALENINEGNHVINMFKIIKRDLLTKKILDDEKKKQNVSLTKRRKR